LFSVQVVADEGASGRLATFEPGCGTANWQRVGVAAKRKPKKDRATTA
jgi:hypothetical protein